MSANYNIPNKAVTIATLIDLLRYRASDTPDKIAFHFIPEHDGPTQTMTYAELDHKAQAIAGKLQMQLGKNERAVLIYPPGLDLIAAYFGCIYAGVISVPVYPPATIKLMEKLQHIIEDAEPSVILTTKEIKEKIRKLNLLKLAQKAPLIKQFVNLFVGKTTDLSGWHLEKPLLITDNLNDEFKDLWQLPAIDGTQLVFLQYTSGSTGKPKGVMVNHSNLLANLSWMYRCAGIQQDSSLVSWLPPYHDMGLIGGILEVLYAGINATLMSPIKFIANPFVWLKAITDYKATISGGPNFAYAACVRKITQEQKQQLNLSSWEIAVNGAEPIHPQILKEFIENFKDVGFNSKAMYPSYGLAEATLCVTAMGKGEGYNALNINAQAFKKNVIQLTDNNDKDKHTAVSSGWVLDDSVKIVNPHTHKLCEENIVGEIWVSNPSVTQGYWKKPELTEQIFCAEIANNKAHTKYLRTGDLGFIHEKQLYVTGRLKDLIIIHGRNYYPQDIEYTVGQAHPAIKTGNCAAFSIEVNHEECLAVVCEIAKVDTNTEKTYQEICKAIETAIIQEHQLTVYTLALIPAKTLLKTTSGKIRRKPIKELFVANQLPYQYLWSQEHSKQQHHEFITPENEIERILVELTSHLLEKDNISVTDDIFHLGANSIIVAQLINRIEERLQVRISPEEIFENPTIRQLATILQINKDERVTQLPIQDFIKSTSLSDKVPLSFQQQRLWFLEQLTPGLPLYNLPAALHLHGNLNTKALIRALQSIINRHDILRTSFKSEDDKVYQFITKHLEIKLVAIDLTSLAEQNRQLRLNELMEKENYTAFDLTQAPLTRYYLYKLNEQYHVLHIIMHHIIADGWSMQVYANELNKFYNAYEKNQNLQIAPVLLQYADYSSWQQTLSMDNGLAYWREVLQGAPTILTLPTDYSRPTQLSYKGDRIKIKIPEKLVKQLKLIAKENQSTLYMVLLAGFASLLYRYTQQEDFIIGTPVVGRNTPELENLIGFFINTLPLRIQISGKMTFLELLNQVRKTSLTALMHQQIPFERIINEVITERSASIMPLVQVMFNMQNFSRPKINLNGLEAELVLSNIMAKFDLSVELIETTEGLCGEVEYSTDLFKASTIEQMIKHLINIYEAIVQTPSKLITRLALLDSDEKQKILVRWNQTAAEYTTTKTLHELFEIQVKKTPENIAVVFEEEQLTYRELNEQANQLAHYLQGNGVKPNDYVGFYLERSLKPLITILAIIKVGGIYVPLDPAYPIERLHFMLHEVNPKFLLTQSSLLNKLKPLESQDKQFNKTIILDWENIESALQEYSKENLNNKFSNLQGLYVIFTSGSTGIPKGVIGTQQGLINRLEWLWHTFPFSKNDVCCQKSSFNFVDHVAELFSPLLKGIPLIFLSNKAIANIDLKLFLEEITLYQVTRIVLVPALLKALLAEVSSSLNQLQNLRIVFCSGEALPHSLVERFHDLLPHCQLVNLYGSSEDSADISYYLTKSNNAEDILSYFKEGLKNSTEYVDIIKNNLITQPAINLEQLKEQFKNSHVPYYSEAYTDYQKALNENTLLYAVNTVSPRFIGHMTSVLPSFTHELIKLMTALNQNVVKIETSKSLTFLEREAIAMLHRCFFNFSENFYQAHIQNLNSYLGVITSGGSISNLTALWTARNNCFPPKENFKGVAIEGLPAALNYYGYNNCIILVSPLLHYSIQKAASLLGIGIKNIHYLDLKSNGKIDINSLQQKIDDCRIKKTYILAIVGVAGATETGSIDPLEEMGQLAKANNIHFHIDASFGGPIIFSNRHKHLLQGISFADTITVCGHKQLYLPMGISVCLFAQPEATQAIYVFTDYQAKKDSFDFGKTTIEGSRPAMSIILHGSLHLLGKRGYEFIIDKGIENVQHLKHRILDLKSFELLLEPVINIVNYRYIPKALRAKVQTGQLSQEDNKKIDEANIVLQEQQFKAGRTFVSKTTIPCHIYNMEVMALRVVLVNPLTTLEDIDAVLLDQLSLAAQYIEQDAILEPSEVEILSSKPESSKLITPSNPVYAPIGKPIANTQIYILDAYLQPLPVGLVGEIYAGGVGLAHGYFNRPDLTAESFIADPFSAEPGARLYKTGDLGRWLPDGNIEYIGRIDNQVKLRGFRIELGEIEEQLIEHPAIQQAVVILREDQLGQPYLAAYYQLSEDKERPTEMELRAYLASRLPSHMLPTTLTALDKFPLNPNGKLDRQALPVPRWAAEHAYKAPSTELEYQCIQTCAELLNISAEHISITANFFELGGHSLLATRYASLLAQATGAAITVKDIFDYPILQNLASKIAHYLLKGKVKPSMIMLQPRPDQIPLSFSQQRFWFLSKLAENVAYNISIALKLQGNLQLQAFAKALQAIISRHEILRTQYIEIEGKIYQKVKPEEKPSLIIEDIQKIYGEFMPAEKDSYLQKIASLESAVPFDFSKSSLLRFRLLHLAKDEYFFIMTIHHSICDGWSLTILGEELSQFYNHYAYGKILAIKPLPIQYIDYTLWQQKNLQDAKFNKQLTYWQKQLADAPPFLDLPTDKPRPEIMSNQGRIFRCSLPAATVKNLEGLCRQEKVTLFMLMLTSLYGLLYRYSGQSDIVIGVPIANRIYAEISHLIGFFVNTLALRTQINPAENFKNLLQQVKSVALNAFQHQEIPFDQLVAHLEIPRQLNRAPVFQVMFVLQNNAPVQLTLEQIEVMQYKHENTQIELDLSFNAMVQANGELVLEIEYAEDLYEFETITRLGGHWCNLLNCISEQLTVPINKLSLLTVQERQRFLIDWNDTQAPVTNKTIYQLFQEQVIKTPEQLALIFEDQQLTYTELNSKANRLAHYLHALGVKPDTVIGVCFTRSFDFIIAVLAILKASAAYVPLDTEYPLERLNYILNDAQAPILLTHTNLAQRFHAFKGLLIAIDKLNLQEFSIQNLNLNTQSRNLAYVIYTSGSTGKPKGISIEHQSLSARLQDLQQCYGLMSTDKILFSSSPSFDVSLEEFMLPLITGATAIIAEGNPQQDPLKLLDILVKKEITGLNLVPASLHILVEQMEYYPDAAQLKLRFVTVGGDILSSKIVQNYFKVCKAALYNLYGPTENTIDSTIFQLDPNNSAHKISIGKPLANSNAYILSTTLELVPIGVVGELYVGGIGLARGYFNKPELTAERFIANPFVTEQDLRHGKNLRLYKTGDLARYLPNGNIEFIGRIDFQVKIRGFRIELGEIEEQLIEHPAIQDAVVILREDQPGQPYLAAYYQPSEDKEPPTETKLRSYLASRLPSHMLPTTLTVLDKFPLSPNGKLDRKALPVPEVTLETSYMAPSNALEEELVSIWQEVLQQEPIGIHDHFFERGGHSLLAAQVVSRIRQTLHIKLPLSQIFQTPTIAGLADFINRSETISQEHRIELKARPETLPLSFAQQRLWFIHQLEPDNPQYNMPILLRIEGPLNISALEQSFNALIARHEILRTYFKTDHLGQAFQVIVESFEFKIHLENMQGCEAQDITHYISAKMLEPFSLNQLPLLRADLLSLQEETYLLLICIHHSISDGWSLGIIARELSRFYTAMVTNQSPNLFPLPLQYADFSIWQRDYLHPESETYQCQAHYWQSRLANIPSLLELPTDFPRPVKQSSVGNSLSFELSAELSQQLTTLCAQTQTTLFMVLLAAFYVLLYRYSGQHDIVVGSPIANRNRREIEPLIGFFVNTLALRAELKSQKRFTEFLEQVKQDALDAFEHQDLPFEQLVDLLKVERNLSYSPVFQVMFILQNNQIPDLHLSGLSVTPEHYNYHITQFDLTLELEETPAGLCGRFEYATALFTEATIARLINHFKVLLQGIVSHPQTRLAELPLLTNQEEQQFIAWNRTEHDYPHGKTLINLFEAQVKHNPNHMAIVDGAHELTYKELNAKANQLARHIRECFTQDIGMALPPDTLIAFCLNRGVEAIISMLAILKAGGAYVPIDPKYPEERIAFILQDTQARLVITYSEYQYKIRSETSCTLILMDKQPGVEQANTNLPNYQHPQNLAYVIYTSGSTGRPKGVMIEHHTVVNLIHYQMTYFNLNPSSKVLQFAAYGFDVSVWEIFSALSSGASLYLLDEQERYDITYLTKLFASNQITHAFLAPALVHTIPKHQLSNFQSLQYLVVGGEPLNQASLKALQELNINVINGYGPTEITIFATLYPYQKDDLATNIGYPIQNVQMYILNEDYHRLPIGIPGELYIGGAGLARGYLNRPDLTAERFIANPFATEEELQLGYGRLYKTGDLCRWLPNGTIEYLGRTDNQVKLRGFRIELGEIERHLNEHPAIQKAVVIMREDVPGNKYLAGYYQLSEDKEPLTETELRSYLVSRLPSHMLPTTLTALDEFPLSPNGKLERKALPVPSWQIQTTTEQAPRNPLQVELVRIWSKILGRDSVGIQEHFFDIGGHSLLAMQLIQALAKSLHIQLPISVIFTHPTIAAMSEWLQTQDKMITGEHKCLIPLKTTGEGHPVFIVHPIGGQVFCYRTLAEHWPVTQPLYGLQQVAHEMDTTSLSKMAAHYIQAIRSIQPTGPYYLAGWSMGGVIAHEMAYQLEQADEEVKYVLLIDSFSHIKPTLDCAYPSLETEGALDRNLLKLFCEDFWKSNGKTCLLSAETLAQPTRWAQLESILLAAKQDKLMAEETTLDTLNFILNTAYQNTLLLQNHQPKTIRSELVLIKAQLGDDHESKENQAEQWRSCTTKELRVHELPGDHYNILQTPLISALVKIIEHYLTQKGENDDKHFSNC